MEKEYYHSSIKRLICQRNILLFFSLVLGLCVLSLSLLLFSKKERLVIVPTTGTSMWLEANQASEAYLYKMGTYISDLLFNRSPVDIEQKNSAILEHTRPESYHEIRRQLQNEKKSITAQNQSFYFRPANSTANAVNNTYVTEGEVLVFIGKEGDEPVCIQQEKRKYTLQFSCKDGRVYLASLTKEKI
ncbi:MAG: type IV conjugative transfer system protein TraE (plasmid) [Candidatus Algichlamydia australiensis]|nr:type IV conjugative transfer system protein TraE [Chlamydiales bacterium]